MRADHWGVVLQERTCKEQVPLQNHPKTGAWHLTAFSTPLLLLIFISDFVGSVLRLNLEAETSLTQCFCHQVITQM